MPPALLEREQPAQQQIVRARITRRQPRGGALEAARGRLESLVHRVVLAELVAQVGIEPARLAGRAPAGRRCGPAWPAAPAVDSPRGRHAPRGGTPPDDARAARGSARHSAHRAAAHARSSWRRGCRCPRRRVRCRCGSRRRNRRGPAQRGQRFAALVQAFVGVEHEAPVGIGEAEGVVARRGEVVDPGEVPDPRARLLRESHGGVAGAGVEHQHVVHPRPRAAQAAADRCRFVARDQHKGDSVHGGGGCGESCRNARETPSNGAATGFSRDRPSRTPGLEPQSRRSDRCGRKPVFPATFLDKRAQVAKAPRR